MRLLVGRSGNAGRCAGGLRNGGTKVDLSDPRAPQHDFNFRIAGTRGRKASFPWSRGPVEKSAFPSFFLSFFPLSFCFPFPLKARPTQARCQEAGPRAQRRLWAKYGPNSRSSSAGHPTMPRSSQGEIISGCVESGGQPGKNADLRQASVRPWFGGAKRGIVRARPGASTTSRKDRSRFSRDRSRIILSVQKKERGNTSKRVSERDADLIRHGEGIGRSRRSVASASFMSRPIHDLGRLFTEKARSGCHADQGRRAHDGFRFL